MLRIRLRRTGAKKQPRYRVVVADSRAPRDGAFVEILGWYNPQAEPSQVVVNHDKLAAWVAKGARPSESVAKILKRASQVAATPEVAADAVAEAPAPLEPAPPAAEVTETTSAAEPASESEQE